MAKAMIPEQIIEAYEGVVCDVCAILNEADYKCRMCKRDLCGYHTRDFFYNPFSDDMTETTGEEYIVCQKCEKVVQKYIRKKEPVVEQYREGIRQVEKECTIECQLGLD